MRDHQRDFFTLALRHQVLRFGEFTLKSGRVSPYFFNAGLFNDGAALAELGRAYATTLTDSGLGFDMLFGPAYKGITLAAAVAIELARQGRNVPFAYNRKEAKDHGEGGTLVGAKLAGRVLIVDDVISAGTSVRESISMIQAAGATPCGVSLSTRPGSSWLSCWATSAGAAPTWLPNCDSVPWPSTLASCSPEIGRLAPVPIHDCSTLPSPAC